MSIPNIPDEPSDYGLYCGYGYWCAYECALTDACGTLGNRILSILGIWWVWVLIILVCYVPCIVCCCLSCARTRREARQQLQYSTHGIQGGYAALHADGNVPQPNLSIN